MAHCPAENGNAPRSCGPSRRKPDELLLDEPTNHLDIQHQLDILSLVAKLPSPAVSPCTTSNLAAMFCDRVAVLEDCRVVAAGRPAAVIIEALVEQVYRMRAGVTVYPVTGYPTVTYRPQSSRHLSLR